VWIRFAATLEVTAEGLRFLARRSYDMQFGGTVLYVDQVSPVVDFYRWAFGLNVRFLDEALGFAELETAAPCWPLLPIRSARC
jgi:hypothetical protein